MHRISYFDHNWLILRKNNENVQRRLGLMRGVVVDLGCGIRPYESEIRRVATWYVGIDWSNTPHLLRADVVADLNEGLPVQDAVADTVVSFQVLEHLKEPEVLLSEAWRILKSGGTIIVTVPFQWAVHEAPYDYFRYTRFGLQHMFAKPGFTDVVVEEVSGFWTTWLLKLNYQTLRLVRGPALVRELVRIALLPIWLADQLLAPLLDHIWPSGDETAGYVIVARKP